MNKSVRLAFFLALVLVFLFQGLGFWLMKPTRIGTVDIVAITSKFVRNEAKNHHSKLEKEAAIKSFSHRLEASLRQLAQQDALILVPKEAVLQGTKEYTQTVELMMQKELKS